MKDMGLISGEFVTGIQAIRAYAPGAYPDLYTGVGGGVPGNPDVLLIYLTDLDPAVEQDLLAVSTLPPEKVRFLPSAVSERDALALQNTIMADSADPAFRERVTELGSFGPGADGLIEFGMTGHDPDQIDYLWQRYGPNVRFIVATGITVAADGSVAAVD